MGDLNTEVMAMNDRRVIVTTSWDDGHELDEKLAEVLDDFGLSGTFYISPQSAEIPSGRRLQAKSIGRLASRFEIGSHTLTHPRLTRLPSSMAEREIKQGADVLEQVIGRPVTSFCYPYGAYRAEHVELVRSLGFSVARTIRRFCVTAPGDLLQMETTCHAARYRRDGLAVLRRSRPLWRAPRTWSNWDVLARQLFASAEARGGVYHLWGHSWEIEANDDWSRLRSLLQFITEHDILPATNGDLRFIS